MSLELVLIKSRWLLFAYTLGVILRVCLKSKLYYLGALMFGNSHILTGQVIVNSNEVTLNSRLLTWTSKAPKPALGPFSSASRPFF